MEDNDLLAVAVLAVLLGLGLPVCICCLAKMGGEDGGESFQFYTLFAAHRIKD